MSSHLKKILLFLGLTYVFVVFMIFFQDRLGLLRIPVLALGALSGFLSFKAMIDFANMDTRSRRERLVVRGFLWLFIGGSVIGLGVQIGARIINLFR